MESPLSSGPQVSVGGAIEPRLCWDDIRRFFALGLLVPTRFGFLKDPPLWLLPDEHHTLPVDLTADQPGWSGKSMASLFFSTITSPPLRRPLFESTIVWLSNHCGSACQEEESSLCRERVVLRLTSFPLFGACASFLSRIGQVGLRVVLVRIFLCPVRYEL